MKQLSLMRAGIGALSLFIVLVILSLSMLSILSFTDAKQKETMSLQFKNHAIATSNAEKEALEINVILQEKNKLSKEDLKSFIESKQFNYDESKNMVSYSIDIDNSQILNVTIKLDNQLVEIIKWEKVGR